MIDWSKFLKVKIETEEDVPAAIQQLAECVPDNMLLSMIAKSKKRNHDLLLKYLEAEKEKRGLQ